MTEIELHPSFKNSSIKLSWGKILIIIGINIVLLLFIVFVLYTNEILTPIAVATEYLIQPTIIASAILFLAFALLTFKAFKLTPIDVGLEKSKIGVGTIILISFWIFIQIYGLIMCLIYIDEPVISSTWEIQGVTRLIGMLIAQIFGNAFYEEILFRGFLIPQIYHKIGSKKSGIMSNKVKIFLAVIISQTIFALQHIPIRILGGMTGWDLVPNMFLLLGIGSMFAILYLHTQNLFVVIAVHALWNTPTVIFSASSTMALILGIIIILVLWKPIEKHFNNKKPVAST